MQTKYFRFNMSDDREDILWGYATGSGEYIGSDSEDVSLDMIQKIPYDEATGVLRSWLKQCETDTATLEIDEAVAAAFSKGSTHAVFRYDDGEKYKMTIETADDPATEWEEFEDDFSEDMSVAADADANGETPYAKVERLWRKATGKEAPAKLCVLSGQKRAISKDGKWIVVDGSRSDEELIEAIKNFA